MRGVLLIVFMPCAHLQQERKHFVWQVLRNYGAAPQRFTYRSAHGGFAPLLSCKATNHSHSLIEGGDLPCAQSPSPPLTRLREGTAKTFQKWVELTLRECKAGFAD